MDSPSRGAPHPDAAPDAGVESEPRNCTIKVSKAGLGQGTITSSAPGIDCGA